MYGLGSSCGQSYKALTMFERVSTELLEMLKGPSSFALHTKPFMHKYMSAGWADGGGKARFYVEPLPSESASRNSLFSRLKTFLPSAEGTSSVIFSRCLEPYELQYSFDYFRIHHLFMARCSRTVPVCPSSLAYRVSHLIWVAGLDLILPFSLPTRPSTNAGANLVSLFRYDPLEQSLVHLFWTGSH